MFSKIKLCDYELNKKETQSQGNCCFPQLSPRSNFSNKAIYGENFKAECDLVEEWDISLESPIKKQIIPVICKYYIYYVSSNRKQEVTKKIFKKIKGPVMDFPMEKIRIYGTLGSKARRQLFSAQSGFSDVFKGLGVVIATLKNLGKLSDVVKECDKMCILDLISLCFSLYDFKTNFSLVSVLKFLINFYTLTKRLGFGSQWIAQSYEPFLLAGASMFLPKELFEIIRRVNVLSNTKILDDFGLFHKLFVTVMEFFEWCFSKMDIPLLYKDKLVNFLSWFKLGKNHVLIHRMEGLVDKANEIRNYMSSAFRNDVNSLYIESVEAKDWREWMKKSPSVQQIYDEFVRVHKICKNYATSSRQEPSLFVLEGPPGCGKSLLLNKVVRILDKNTYTHIVKSQMEGKDFYDSYNNEPVFIMDDVGQMGVSQWRCIINFVSSVKLPLDCAQANLKDTKFFNSEIIGVTTNCFTNINGLTKQDCISHVDALHRRGNVFDMSRVKQVEGKWEGEIIFKSFCLKRKVFISDFPEDFSQYLRDRSIDLKSSIKFDKTRSDDVIAWVVNIINLLTDLRNLQSKSNEITAEQITSIKSKLFVPQSSELEFYDADWISTNYPIWDDYSNDSNYFYKIWRKWWFSKTIIDYYVNFRDSIFDIYNNVLKDNLGSSIWYGYVLYMTMSILIILYKLFFKLTKSVLDYISDSIIGEVSKLSDLDIYKSQSKIMKDYGRNLENVHSSIQKVNKQMYLATLQNDEKLMEVIATVSGINIIVPAHSAFSDRLTITLKDLEGKCVVDHIKVDRVYMNIEHDVAIFKLPKYYPTPFKSVRNFIKPQRVEDYNNAFLCNLFGVVPVPSVHVKKGVSATYKRILLGFSDYVNNFDKDRDLFYKVHGTGMCGTLVIDSVLGICGMHVAGSEVLETGVAIMWNDKVKNDILSFLDDDFYLNPIPISEKSNPHNSAIKLDCNLGISVPVHSNLAPTSLYGMYDSLRTPANLTKYGVGTIHTIAKKSTDYCQFVDMEAVEFGKRAIKVMLNDIIILSDKEVIHGNDWLAPLNKDSSNGFNMKLDKTDYIDFVNGVVKEPLQVELDKFYDDISNKIYPVDQLVWQESLKDELRDNSKNQEPRSFRVGTLSGQFLMKRYFGNMVEHIMKNRSFNQIQVGINPFVEWNDIYYEVDSCKIKWAGDVAKWDGKMSPQVQQAVSELLLDCFADSDKEVAGILLSTLTNSIVGIMNTTIMTTHSMPSGSYLTAIFNSIVNRFYTAMWYYNSLIKCNLIPTVTEFHQIVVDKVYGDDKLNGVRKYENILNAISMRDYFQGMAMDFTDASKNPIKTVSQDWTEITFLKRSFIYHNILKKVMCPLSLVTLQTGLQFFDQQKDHDIVILDKLHNYQREIYLHAHREVLLQEFLEKLQIKQIKCAILSERYLINLYTVEVDKIDYFGSHSIKYV